MKSLEKATVKDEDFKIDVTWGYSLLYDVQVPSMCQCLSEVWCCLAHIVSIAGLVGFLKKNKWKLCAYNTLFQSTENIQKLNAFFQLLDRTIKDSKKLILLDAVRILNFYLT